MSLAANAPVDPSAFAPYDDPRDYITSWTDRIWIARGLGHLADHYDRDVRVHTAYGETYGYDDVMRNSVQRMSAFPNRGGGHEDVVWEARGPNGFVSSHRVLNAATHSGFWTYGPPTGRQWINRGTAHCLVRDNKVVEEWVVRDEFSVLQGMGIDPFTVARDLARRSPVLGNATSARGAAFDAHVANPLASGISGDRPGHHREACEQVVELVERVWNGRFLDEAERFLAPTVAVTSVRMRRAMGIAPWQNDLIDLLACFPDSKVDILDIAAHRSPDLGLRVAMIWLLRGTYSGVPAYGPTNGTPVRVLGSSHFEWRRGRIVREWRMFDEIAVIAQIVGGADGTVGSRG